MSVSEFNAALRNKAINEWFLNEKRMSGADRPDSQKDKNSTQVGYTLDYVNNIVSTSSEYRSTEQTSEKTSFIITKSTIAGLLIDLKGEDPNSDGFETLVDEVFKNFRKKNAGIKVNRRKITVGKDMPAIFFGSISFDSITNLVNSILNLSPGELAKYYEKGHVISINTSLLQQTRNRIQDIDTRGSSGKSKIIQELDKVIAYYARLDIESANIQPAADISVYASATKILTKTGGVKYLVELQPKSKNQRSADEVKATIQSIRKLFTPGALSEVAMVKTIDKLLKVVSDSTFKDDLLKLRSSPSYLDLIGTLYSDTIKGTSKDAKFIVPKSEIDRVKVKAPDLSKLRNAAKQEVAKAKKVKASLVKRAKKSRIVTNLVSLQSLLNANLAQKIKENMGDGNRRDILNLRTGRFAESAKVERLSESRAGMITAFYTYMKNPYATFSEGGRQQYPRSRDPKLLISKSIREIAAEQVANRMRAVVV